MSEMSGFLAALYFLVCYFINIIFILWGCLILKGKKVSKGNLGYEEIVISRLQG